MMSNRLFFWAGVALCLFAIAQAKDSWTLWATIGLFWMSYSAWQRAAESERKSVKR